MNPLPHLPTKISGKLQPLKFPYPVKKPTFSLKLMHLNCTCGISIIEALSKFFVLLLRNQDESAVFYHYTPFKMYLRRTPNSEPEHIISELYTADAFWEGHEKIAKLSLCLPNDPPGHKPVENTVLALIIWLDSTHLSSFETHQCGPPIFILGISRNTLMEILVSIQPIILPTYPQ